MPPLYYVIAGVLIGFALAQWTFRPDRNTRRAKLASALYFGLAVSLVLVKHGATLWEVLLALGVWGAVVLWVQDWIVTRNTHRDAR